MKFLKAVQKGCCNKLTRFVLPRICSPRKVKKIKFRRLLTYFVVILCPFTISKLLIIYAINTTANPADTPAAITANLFFRPPVAAAAADGTAPHVVEGSPFNLR
jgi:hypothetical protein